MKKIIIVVFVIVSAVIFNKVNAQAFDEGKIIVQAGYGFPNMGKVLFKAVGSATQQYKATGIGPIHARFEYGLTDEYGIGVSFNLATYGATWLENDVIYNSNTGQYSAATYDVKVSAWNILIRASRHWDVNDKVDIYSGFGLGYSSRKAKVSSNDPNYTVDDVVKNIIPIGFEWTVGMRYFFTDNIGIYVEGGYAKSILQGGIVGKF